MRIKLLCVGKTTDRFLQQLIDEYHQRINRYLKFEMFLIKGIKHKGNRPQEEIKEMETKQIIENLKPSDTHILLDEKGEEYSSKQFSKLIGDEMLKGTKQLSFISGGAYGFSEDIYGLVKKRVSLSKMTFSHQMIRLIFAEQLYRALTIINNEPYHHE